MTSHPLTDVTQNANRNLTKSFDNTTNTNLIESTTKPYINGRPSNTTVKPVDNTTFQTTMTTQPMTTMGSSSNTVINTSTNNGLGKNPRYDNSTTIEMGTHGSSSAPTEPSAFTTTADNVDVTTNVDYEPTTIPNEKVTTNINKKPKPTSTVDDDKTRIEMSGGPTMN